MKKKDVIGMGERLVTMVRWTRGRGSGGRTRAREGTKGWTKGILLNSVADWDVS